MKKNSWNEISNDLILESFKKVEDMKPLMVLENEDAKSIFNNCKKKVMDEWQNTVASVDANNSITQYNQFLLRRLPYAECSNLATDGIIHNAISKHTNECFRRGYKIILNDLSEDLEALKIEKMLAEKIKQKKVIEILRKAVETSLTYGNALVYFGFDCEDLAKEQSYQIDVIKANPLKYLNVVSPFLTSAISANTTNPLELNYMKPDLYAVSGGQQVHGSRFHNLIIFDVPDLLKPLFNFGGLSLCGFMKDAVGLFETNRKAQGDIALRFRNTIIKTDLVEINPEEAKARAKYIATSRNNLGVMLLKSDEEYIEAITPLTGLDAIGEQTMQAVGVYAQLAINTLFGTTPSGLNSTGEFELKTQYNQTQNFQNNIIKPLFVKILRIFCLEEGLDIWPEIEFKELDTNAQKDLTEIHKMLTDVAGANVTAQIWTEEQAFKYLQDNGVISQSEKYEEPEFEGYDDEDNEESEIIDYE